MFGCGHVHMRAGVCRGQRHWIPLELEFHTVVRSPTWMRGIKLQPSAGTVCTEPLQPLQKGFTNLSITVQLGCSSHHQAVDPNMKYWYIYMIILDNNAL